MDTVSPRPQNGNWPFGAFPHKISGIYQITNTLTGDFYIGSSADIEKRWKEHVKRLRRSINGCVILQRAWAKYGEEAFVFSVLEEVEREKTALLAREDYYIQTLKPAYNSTFLANSHLGMKRSEGTKEKLRNRPPMSEEQKQYLREINEGKTMPEETKEKIRQTSKARFANMTTEELQEWSAVRKAAAERPETKARMSTAQTYNNNKPGARERQRQSHLGYKQTTEHTENAVKARKERKQGREREMQDNLWNEHEDLH